MTNQPKPEEIPEPENADQREEWSTPLVIVSDVKNNTQAPFSSVAEPAVSLFS